MLYREIIAVCSQIHTKHINTLCGQNAKLLGAFAKLGKSTISFVTSVCLPVHMNQLCSHRTNFHEILYLGFFNLSKKFQFHYNLTRITSTSDVDRYMYIYDHISLNSC